VSLNHYQQNRSLWNIAFLRRFCQTCPEFRPTGFHFFGFHNNIFLQSKIVSLPSNPQLRRVLSRVCVATIIRRVLDWQLDLLDHTQLHKITVYTLYNSQQLSFFSCSEDPGSNSATTAAANSYGVPCHHSLSSHHQLQPLRCRILTGLAQSQSHFTTDDQSVSPSRCRAPSGAHDHILITVWQLLFCRYRAPPLTRGRVCHLI
jgi:hypothetical protein